MIKLTSLINELKVVDIAGDKNEPKKYFLLYKDKLFILDNDSPTRNITSRLKSHVKSHPMLDPIDKWGALKQDDIPEFLTRVAELAPDVVVGNYYPKNHAIVVWNMSEIQPRTSLNIKKIANQLDLEKVTYRHVDDITNDDNEIDYSPQKLVGDIPSVVFHGTSTHVLKNILKYGLYPGKGTSNFSSRGIYHTEYIFFTATFQAAIFYALNAKRENSDNFPIVIEFQIPDKNLLYPDYDADISTTTKRHFPRLSDPPAKSTMKSMGLSRETGKWAYKGRIPASHIQWIYYYIPSQKKWKKSKPDTWRKLLDKYDWELIGWKLNLITAIPQKR